MGLWNGHPGADNGVWRRGWRTSPAEPRRAADCLQPTLRCGFRQQLTPGAHYYTHPGDRVSGSFSCYNARSIATRRREAMSHWVETEMGACQLHDARHAKRLAHL
jgi:hypothetical protein